MSRIDRSRPWWLNPYLHLILNGILVAASQILLKRAALEGRTGLGTLASGWAAAGILCYIAGFVNWLQALRWVPLSIAFPITSGAHVLIPIGSLVFFNEQVGPVRWIGILLVVIGISFCARAKGAS